MIVVKHPRIIQGGMGIGLSDWRLARAVSICGQLGTVSGSGLWMVMTRRLQDGDPGGNARRALAKLPFPDVAERMLQRYFISGGKPHGRPYCPIPMLTHPLRSAAAAMLVAASFVEVFLAKEGHDGQIAINYLEKIQLAHLPSLYGAMLAGVDYVIMGAGVPQQIPGALDRLALHQSASYRLAIADAQSTDVVETQFDPASLGAPSDADPLRRPKFLPIVSSHVLAAMLLKRSNGHIDGFVVEGPTPGGHNAPPRSRRRSLDGVPSAYTADDDADLDEMLKLGRPFWLAGSKAHAGALADALATGAYGIQAGSIFALCRDSALRADLRERAIDRALDGALEIRTNFTASPSGFPFKEAVLDGTLTDPGIYARRARVCDLGALRTPYRAPNGSLGYRCSAEPVEAFEAKGGDIAKTAGASCLCNALTSTIGRAQTRSDGFREPPLLTLGSDLSFLHALASPRDYSASDVIELLAGCDVEAEGSGSILADY